MKKSNLFPKMCRVCLSENISLVPIKEIYFTHDLTENRGTTIIDLISVFKQFCNIEVSFMDQKPQKICENCISLAGKAFNFFQLFLHSNQELERKLQAQNIVTNLQIKPELNVDYEEEIIIIKDETAVESPKSEIIENDDDDVIDSQDEIKVDAVQKTEDCQSQIDVNKKAVDRPKKCMKVRASAKSDRENDIFRCNPCQKKGFHGLKEILKHVEEEHNLLKQCVICKNSLMKSSYREYHYATHSSKSIVCKRCRVVFETKESLEEHLQSLEHNNRSACPACKRIFISRIRMKCHFRAVHKKRNLQCAYCSANFNIPGNLKRHERRHKGEIGSFLCAHCGKVFTTNFSLKIHVQKIHKIDQGMDRYMNYKPKRTPKQQEELPKPPAEREEEDSKVRKTRSPKYQCKFCNFRYMSYTHYLKHCSFHPEFEDFSCITCKLPFASLNEYLEHEKCHYRFPCSVCGKKFASASRRWQHKLTHKNDKHVCEICNYSCTLKTRFDEHMISHGPERRHVCEICGTSFKQMATLRTHIRTLHQTKPLSCRFCGMKFLFNGVLKIHLRTHTGVKPFGCPYCAKKFIDTTGRNRHVKSYHPEKTEDYQIYKQQYQEEEIQNADLEDNFF